MLVRVLNNFVVGPANILKKLLKLQLKTLLPDQYRSVSNSLSVYQISVYQSIRYPWQPCDQPPLGTVTMNRSVKYLPNNTIQAEMKRGNGGKKIASI